MAENEKLIPKRRFKEFQNAQAWVQRKLGDVGEIVRGSSPRPIQDPKWFDKSSDVGWLRISDVTEQNGRIFYLDQKISKAGQEKTRVLTEPHLLLSIAATVGKPVINYIKTGVHDGFLIFSNPTFEREFMFQWLEMFRVQWQNYGQPGSQINLNSNLVKNQEILIPTINEQTAIGSFFRTIDDTITLQLRKLEKTKALKSAYLSEMFPAEGERVPKRRFTGFTDEWEQRKFSDIVNRVSIQSNADNCPKVEFEDIISGEGRLNKDVSRKFDKRKGIAFEAGNILYGKLRPYLNNWLFADFKGIALGDFWVFEANNSCSIFDYYLIQTKKYQESANLSTGTKMPRSDWKIISETNFSIPCKIEEQEQIGNFFRTIDNLITHHQQKLDKLQNIKKAYLNEMFI